MYQPRKLEKPPVTWIGDNETQGQPPSPIREPAPLGDRVGEGSAQEDWGLLHTSRGRSLEFPPSQLRWQEPARTRVPEGAKSPSLYLIPVPGPPRHQRTQRQQELAEADFARNPPSPTEPEEDREDGLANRGWRQ